MGHWRLFTVQTAVSWGIMIHSVVPYIRRCVISQVDFLWFPTTDLSVASKSNFLADQNVMSCVGGKLTSQLCEVTSPRPTLGNMNLNWMISIFALSRREDVVQLLCIISILTRDGVTWEEILSDVSMSSTESTNMAKGRAAVSSWSLSTTVIISPSSLRYFFPMTTMDILFGVCIPEVWKFNLVVRYIQQSHWRL